MSQEILNEIIVNGEETKAADGVEETEAAVGVVETKAAVAVEEPQLNPPVALGKHKPLLIYSQLLNDITIIGREYASRCSCAVSV